MMVWGAEDSAPAPGGCEWKGGMGLEAITSWNLPRVLLDLVPEVAPALARLAVGAYDIDPGALGLPDDEPRRLQPDYGDDPHKPMSLVELIEAYQPSARAEALNAALGSCLGAEFSPYSVLFEFKHSVLVPALRDPGSQDLVDRSGRFLEAALGAEEYVSETVRLQVFEGAGIEGSMVARLVASGGPLLTDALRQQGYPVP
jgi:hypothetical protein